MMVVLPRGVVVFFCTLFTLAIVVSTRSAHAQTRNPRAYPVHVLAIDSEDAEDQAEALTHALRSRVRATPGWSLLDTAASLSTLTAALKCPKVPDAPCLGRIADQLKTERFVWGTMTKSPGNQVTADVHLYVKGKPDATAKESYSDNLKDGNDETLRRIAQHAFDRLAGMSSGGALVVHAGSAGGIVNVDGTRRATLEGGDATIELTPGTYKIEVLAAGFAPAHETATVVAGKDSSVTLSLVPSGGVDSKPLPVRRIASYAAIGVGAALLVAGGLEGLAYANLASQQKEARSRIDPSITDVCQVSPGTPYYDDANTACGQYHSGRRISLAAWVFTGIGAAALGTGVYLLATDTSNDAKPGSDRPKARIRVIPELTARSGGLNLVGSF